MNKVVFTILIVSLISCTAPIDIFKEAYIEPTHSLNHNKIKELIDYFLIDDGEFKGWNERDDKLLFLSLRKCIDDSLEIRAYPTFRKTYAVPLLKNDYYGYMYYKDILIILWSNEPKYFKKLNVPKRKIFDEKVLNKVVNGDYYGVDFILIGDSLIVKDRNYLPSPIF